MVASSCLTGPGAVIKYLMDVVCSRSMGFDPHAFRLDSGQASHCNVIVVSVMPAVWSGVCVFEPHVWGAKSLGWVVVVVLLGCFR